MHIPADFQQWCHGYVVTSHKAQGWTADHVVVAAERITSKGAYVACSRGRKSCVVHTPDKARLVERLAEGNRRAALDALSEICLKNASIVNRVRTWKQLSVDLAQRLATSNSTIDRPDANCTPAEASEPVSQSIRVYRKECPYCPTDCVCSPRMHVHRDLWTWVDEPFAPPPQPPLEPQTTIAF